MALALSAPESSWLMEEAEEAEVAACSGTARGGAGAGAGAAGALLAAREEPKQRNRAKKAVQERAGAAGGSAVTVCPLPA
jgi:hypothetical protein